MKHTTDKILIFTLIVIIPILHLAKTLDPSLHIQYFALSVCLFAFFVFQIIQKRNFNIAGKGARMFTGANILFIQYSVISLFISDNQPDAIFIFSKYILFFTLFLAILQMQNQQLFSIWVKAAMVLSFVILIPGYWQLFELINEKQLIIPNGTYNIKSVFAHRNLFSEMLILILPFSVYAYFYENSFWKYLGIIISNLAFIMIIILSNRASWLSILLYISVVFVFLIIERKQFFANKRKLIFLLNFVVLITICAVFFNTFSDTLSLKSHATNIVAADKGSVKDRLELWQRTYKLITENPALGSGLGTWKIEILKFGNAGLVSENNTTFYQRPHNDFLWIAAEQGIIGVILYFLMFAIILDTLIRRIKNSNEEQKIQSVVVLSITLSFLIFSLFSFPKERISHNLILFAVWGIVLCNPIENANRIRQFTFQWVHYLFLILLLAFMLIGFKRIKGEIHTKKAILAKNEGKFKVCISEIENGKSFFYKIDETSTPLSWYAGNASFQLGDFKRANEYFTDALRCNPNHLYVLNDYAGSLVKSNQIDEAVKYYQKAIEIAPNFDEAKLNLCAIYFNLQKFELAFELLKTIDIKNTSPRYEKTVRIILRQIIEYQLKTGNTSTIIAQEYDLNKNSNTFYKELLFICIKHDIRLNDILYFYE